jgi:hypothetical protein
MAKVKGILKHASAPTLTASGKKSEVRAVDPQDTVVEVENKSDPQPVLEAVRKYCKALAEKKAAEEAAAEHAEVLRAYVGELREGNAKQGDYQKTYRVVGERKDKVLFQADVSQSDKWIAIKGVDLKAVRSKVGAVFFDAIAEEDTTISIKDEILKNRAERVELSKALEAALGIEGIKKYFKKETIYVVREGMDKKQYALPDAEKAALEGGFKQAADTVKDASQAV